METSKNKNCENCRFYKQHYVKTSSGYKSILCGHCTNSNINYRSKMKIRENCEFWQPMEIQKANRKKDLIDNLKFLAKRLDAVCEVLLDDID